MNAKKAKALRKEIGFNNKAEREYNTKVTTKVYTRWARDIDTGCLTLKKEAVDKVTLSNDPKTPRAIYQAAKKVA